jgi:Ca-activated chloride channel homolog
MMIAESTSSLPIRLELFGDIALADPIFLVAIPVVLIALWIGRRPAARPTLRAPLPTARIPRTWRTRLLFLPITTQILGLLCVIVALARPIRYDVLEAVTSEGVDIVLAVDRSSSMVTPDLEEGRTRLEVVRDVVSDFAQRRMTDTEGASDNVALLSFARYPELRCPFTLDVDALQTFLANVEIVEYQQEDGTAIGAALAKAVALLSDSDAKSKVIVLLTDGENNVDDIAPETGLAMAKNADVTVYTILAAKQIYERDQYGRWRGTGLEPDSQLLELIAKETGGAFYRVRDRESLESVYDQIEELERTPREEERSIETRDLYPGVLAAALALLTLARMLGSIGLRRNL